MMCQQIYKLTALYNLMLLINLNAIHIQDSSSQGLELTEILYKSCRKNVSQQQNQEGPILVDIFTFNKPSDHSHSLKSF